MRYQRVNTRRINPQMLERFQSGILDSVCRQRHQQLRKGVAIRDLQPEHSELLGMIQSLYVKWDCNSKEAASSLRVAGH